MRTANYQERENYEKTTKRERAKYEESEIRKKTAAAIKRCHQEHGVWQQQFRSVLLERKESLAPMCLPSARNAQRVPLQSARSQREYTQCELIFAEYFGNSRHRRNARRKGQKFDEKLTKFLPILVAVVCSKLCVSVCSKGPLMCPLSSAQTS